MPKCHLELPKVFSGTFGKAVMSTVDDISWYIIYISNIRHMMIFLMQFELNMFVSSMLVVGPNSTQIKM